MTRRFWTAAEVELLTRNYADSNTADIAQALGRQIGSVHFKASELGLKKSVAFIAEQARANIARPEHPANRSRFQPGLVPWNKGVPGSTGTQAGCRTTQFRKGRPAHEARNYLPIGSLRVSKDGTLQRKVTDDPSVHPAQRWVAVSRLVWEDKHGPVPSGYAVVFRPGQKTTDPEQITADRLELLSRRDLMLRNTVHRYGPEIAQLAQLRGAITRQINQRIKEQTP